MFLLQVANWLTTFTDLVNITVSQLRFEKSMFFRPCHQWSEAIISHMFLHKSNIATFPFELDPIPMCELYLISAHLAIAADSLPMQRGDFSSMTHEQTYKWTWYYTFIQNLKT